VLPILAPQSKDTTLLAALRHRSGLGDGSFCVEMPHQRRSIAGPPQSQELRWDIVNFVGGFGVLLAYQTRSP
jgi:hypothetical protein